MTTFHARFGHRWRRPKTYIGVVWSWQAYKYGRASSESLYASFLPPTIYILLSLSHCYPRLSQYFAFTNMRLPSSSSILFASLAISSSSSSLTLAAPTGDSHHADTGLSASSSNHHVASRRGSFSLPRSDVEDSTQSEQTAHIARSPSSEGMVVFLRTLSLSHDIL